MTSALNQKLFTVLLAVSDLADANIIPEFDNRPRPTSLYMTYNFVYNPVGLPHLKDPKATGVREKVQNWLCEASLNFYYAGAKNACYSFWENLFNDAAHLVMLAQGVSFLRNPVFQDLTALEDTKYQERYLLTFTFTAQTVTTDTIAFIETLEGSMTLDESKTDLEIDLEV